MAKSQTAKQKNKKPLKFKVAPHIVQDLGLNLYTTLPRVLVEFVANAYDADSPDARISLDLLKIEKARRVLKKEWELEQERNGGVKKGGHNDLSQRTLPPDIQIVVSDHGHGMSRDDIQNKFLIAGRRRREVEKKVRSDGGRILMGRKGLGKLAGFGVARTVVIISRKKGEKHATKITLDYDELIKKHVADEVEIKDELLANGGGIKPYGTTVILSRLAYEPTKSREETIGNDIGDHFELIDPAEFAITLNSNPVMPTPRNLAFAYPSPGLPPDKTVEHSYETDDGTSVKYQYRIRFTAPSEHLNARERGVRVYAHKRLAAAPDLLDMTTGIHGFNNTHYLDGIVHADFIDDNNAVDYIATDRQTLRWDSSLLIPMRAHLSAEMEEACKEYQKTRETRAKQQVRNDPFTKKLVEKAKLPKHRKNLAYKVAATLAAVTDKGLESDEYKKQMPIFVDGLVQGNILNSLAELAANDQPDFHRLVGQVVELTHQELGDFLRVVQGRLDGIEALKKLVEDADFKKAKNEDKLHELFEKAPWLIDPTFTQFLTSDRSENELNKQLSKELGIGKFAPTGYDSNAPEETKALGTNRRPDLVFLLSNTGLMRIIIVELKAPNTPLHVEHLRQLKSYIRRAEKWLKNNGRDIKRYKVEGILIGSHAKPNSTAEAVEELRDAIEKEMEKADWKVFGINEVLDRTMRAHRELLDIYERAMLSVEEDEDESGTTRPLHSAA